MLHRITVRPRHVVADERVTAALVRRKLAIHAAFLGDYFLKIGGEGIEVSFAPVVMDRDPEERPRLVCHVEGALREGAELGWAVHQVLKVRCRERERVRSRHQLRGHAPPRACGRIEADGHRTRIEAARPHESGRHVDVRVRAVDREVRAVDAIAEDAIAHAHRAGVTADIPLRGIRL